MRDDRTFNAWQRLAGREPLEVVECDQCGFTQAVESEDVARRYHGWTFHIDGTMCPTCGANWRHNAMYETGVECDGVIVAMTRRVQL